MIIVNTIFMKIKPQLNVSLVNLLATSVKMALHRTVQIVILMTIDS